MLEILLTLPLKFYKLLCQILNTRPKIIKKFVYYVVDMALITFCYHDKL